MQGGNNQNTPYTYIDAGFNGFFCRSLNSSPSASRLGGQMGARQVNQNINFDQQQVSGFMGDVVQIGRITLDGKEGKVSVYDENKVEMARLGPADV